MPYYRFERNDVLYNTIEAHPHYEFVLNSGSIYLNNYSSSAYNLSNGHISLREINVNRDPSLHTYNSRTGLGTQNLAYSFVTKDGTMNAFAATSTTQFRWDEYGTVITSSYPMSASIARYYVATGSNSTNRKRIKALRTSIDFYKKLSPRYDYTTYNYGAVPMGLVSLPAIFYGSSIEKGSVKLKFYVTGTLVAEAFDRYKNGELIQVTGSTTGSCVGMVLYKEGFILLTGSTTVATTGDNYNTCEIKDDSGTAVVDNNFNWTYWGEMGVYGAPLGSSYCSGSGNSIGSIQSSSYALEFKGTTRTPVITMFAHAPKGELNFSTNPTFVAKPANAGSSENDPVTSSLQFLEPKYRLPKNTISSSYANHSASFRKQTFISYMEIYDENHECIAIAKKARPIKKLEERGYTFKLKLDI